MDDQVLSVLRGLPREKLEDVAMHAMAELRMSRFEGAPSFFFAVLLSGLILGTAIAASGFAIGAALR